jgi:outer membrane protein OmpA-like peptidoglycan-associated protein
MKRLLLSLFILFLCCQCIAQELPLNGDCANAVEIAPKGKHSFSSSPVGFGDELEISGNSLRSKQYIRQEHNSAWFWFDALSDDQLVFKIYPRDTKADFDFMLFKYTDENFCADVKSKKTKPIRSNISRNKPDEFSATGLSVGSNEEYVKAGIGNHLSKALSPTKGERYYLLIDNENGVDSAFRILFDYYRSTVVSGVVEDEETGKPIGGATVSWEEKTGEVLAKTTSDPITGEYILDAPVRMSPAKRPYSLAISTPSHFFSEQMVMASDKKPVLELKTILPKLKKGKKMILRNILFMGGQSRPLPSSKPSFRRLHRLMKANKNLEIKIEGHTNGCLGDIEYSQQLSENRANRVLLYLADRGIAKSRITSEGFNCSRMLPKPGATQVSTGGHNRRVEFIVTNF